jgi:hypothetical protein
MGILQDLTGKTAADASRKAAADQYAKEQAAITGIQQAGTQAQGDYASTANLYNPYIQQGQAASDPLMALLGLGGDQAGAVANYRNLPGYQSGLETGTQAAMRAANAGGGLDRGAAFKSLQRFGSDYEDQRFGDYLSRLMGLNTQGLGATGQKVGTIGQGIGANLGARTSAFGGQLGSAKTIGQGDIAAAQAQQSGLQGLLGTGAYLGGQALGGPLGGAATKKFFA